MTWIGLGLLALLLLYAVALYNGLVQRRNRVRSAWAQIDVQLRRRHDLVPNLVASAKGSMEHERGIFDAITRARQEAIAAGGNVAARAEAENGLTRSMRSLFALTEASPQLRASETMLRLQEELASTENRIAYARQFYNDAVLDYNNALGTVPSNFVAGTFAFRPEPLFEIDVAAREPVPVKF